MATTKTTKKSGTRKKTNSTSYKSSTKRYKNTTLYRTTATKRRKLSTGTRESTMTVHYRSVPNHPKKPKTASKAKTTTTKKSTTKTAKPKTASKAKTTTAKKATTGATTSKPQSKTATKEGARPMLNRRPMTDSEYEYYKLGYGKPSKVKRTSDGKLPKTRTNSEYDAYVMGKNRRWAEERSEEDREIAKAKWAGPTLAGKTVNAPAHGTENKYAVKATFIQVVETKLPNGEKMSVHNRSIYNIMRETEKAAYCMVETYGRDGNDHRRDVWIPKACIEVH